MAKATSSLFAPAAPASFESALSELETIVKSLELGAPGGAGNAGGLPLEESLAAYQRGMTLLRYCQDALLAAEQKIQILEKDALRDFTPAAEE